MTTTAELTATPRSTSRSGAGGRLPTARPLLRLRLQAAAVLLLTAGLLAAALGSFAAARSDLHRLAVVSEPRAAAAADLYRALADLDAQHANALVVGYSSAPAPDGQPPLLVDDGVLAALTAQADRRQVGRDLTVLAASDAGSADVQTLFDALGTYDSLSGTEEFSATSQSAPVVGRPPDLALDYYDQAEGLLQESLLPPVKSLLAAADRQVDADRGAMSDASDRGALLLAVVGAVGLLLLVWWQLDLARRHRRMFNPPLLAASAMVLATALAGGLALLGAAADVRSAVSEGFAPGSVVSQAQVTAADAEATESRWLVDAPYRGSLASQFTELTQRLGTLSTGGAGAADVVRTRKEYLAADVRLRSLASEGQIDQASVQLTGVTRGQVAFAYYDYSTQLERQAADRASQFDAGTAAAADDLGGWSVIASVLLAVALLLVVVGVRPRLAEYS